MNSKLTTVAAIAAACLFTGASAWKYEGHILVARMAYDQLLQESPAALKKAESLLEVMSGENLTSSERDHIFVEAAPFADMIKYKGGGWQSNWHFIDTPYLDKKGDNINNYPNFKFDAKNISEAIPGVVNWLTGAANHKESFVYTTVMNAVKQNEERGKSYALRLLIHYLGDIHQPLHALSRVNADYPEGDRGGNDLPLKNHYSADELHAVWDSVIYEFHTNDKLPYDEAGWNKLTTSVDKLKSRFNIKPAEYSAYDPHAWAMETFKTGSENAYEGVVPNEVLPADYVSKNNEIAARQLVLASHRLVKVIQLIFGEKTLPVEDQQQPQAFLQ